MNANRRTFYNAGVTSPLEKVNLAEKFAQFTERWSPKVVGELNDSFVKLAKLEGEFIWHHHANEDELFLVVKGRLRMRFRDRDVVIEPGEFIIVPRGVEHLPVADDECWIVLVEPQGTLNTGDVVNDRTVSQLDRL